MSATIMTLRDEAGNPVAPRTSANAVMTESGISVEAALQQVGPGGGGSIVELPDNLVYMDEEGEDVSVAIKDVVYRYAPHNLLDNSDFRNPVNQRGQTTYTPNYAYTIDRFFSNDSLVSLSADGLTVKKVGNTNFFFIQRIPFECADRLVGKSVTLAVGLADGRVLCGSKLFPPTDNLVHEIFGVNDECYAGLFNLEAEKGIGFYTHTDSINIEFTLKWVALYEGEYTAETLPPYIPKGYGAELLECQRYFYLLPQTAGTSAYPAYASGTTNARVTIHLPMPLRATPNVTIEAIGNVTIFDHTGTGKSATAHTVAQNIRNHLVLNITTSGLTAWSTCTARFNTRVEISADL